MDEKNNQKNHISENQEIKQLLQKLNDKVGNMDHKVSNMDHKVGNMDYKVDKLENEVGDIKKKLIAQGFLAQGLLEPQSGLSYLQLG